MKYLVFILSSVSAFGIGFNDPAWMQSANEVHYNAVYPAPTMYVSLAGDNSNGRTWATAFTTMAAAEAAATNGEVITVDGGWYNMAVTDNTASHKKQLTIYGSTLSGHNSKAVFCGPHYFATPTNGGISLLANCVLRTTNSTDALNLFDNWNFYKVQWGPFSSPAVNTSGTITEGAGTNYVFSYCSFYPNINTGAVASVTALFSYSGNIQATNVCNYCSVMPGAQSLFQPRAALYNLYLNNCLFLSPLELNNTGALNVNSAMAGGYGLYVTNCVFYGTRGSDTTTNIWVSNTSYSTAETTINPSNTFTTVNAGYGTGAGQGEFNCITNSILDFVIGTNRFGKLFLRIDDNSNATNAVFSAQVLNPYGVLSIYAWIDAVQAGYTRNLSNEVWCYRYLVNHGNEVGCHTRTHSPATPPSMFTISSTGTTPTLSVTTTNIGDSTNWTGTLSITVNSVVTNFDLTVLTNSVLSSLVTVLNGRHVGDGILTCAKVGGGSPPNDRMSTLILSNIVNISISSSYTALWNPFTFSTNEIVEAVADLQSYIRYGYDRNGSNQVIDSTGATSITSNYVVKTFAAPYFANSWVAVMGCTNAGLLGAWQAAPATTTSVIYNRGVPINPYGFAVLTTGTATNDYGMQTAVFSKSAAGATWKAYLIHGKLTYGSTNLDGITNLMIACKRWNLGNVTFGDALKSISDDTANWSVQGTNIYFIGDYQDFVKPEWYKMSPRSLLLNAGTSSPTNTTDFGGYKVPRRGAAHDVGPFELQ